MKGILINGVRYVLDLKIFESENMAKEFLQKKQARKMPKGLEESAKLKEFEDGGFTVYFWKRAA